MLLPLLLVGLTVADAAITQDAGLDQARDAAVPSPAASRGMHVFSTLICAGQVEQWLGNATAIMDTVRWLKAATITKVYVESFRGGFRAKRDTLVAGRRALAEAGFEVAGCIATTALGKASNNYHDVSDYNNATTQADLAAEFAFAASLGDGKTIIDDFFFTDDTSADSSAGLATQTVTLYPSEHNNLTEKLRIPVRNTTDASCPGNSCPWKDYNRALMLANSEYNVLAAAKAVNPNATVTLKFPQWYDRYVDRGYDVVAQTAVFDQIWVGTEVRDYYDSQWGGTPPYEGFFVMRWLGAVGGAKTGGGWYDTLGTSPATFIEQARQNILGGAAESFLFNYNDLREPHGASLMAALAPQMDELRTVAAEVGRRQLNGIVAYKPPNSHAGCISSASSEIDARRADNGGTSFSSDTTCIAEGNVWDFLGMLGFPLIPVAEYPPQNGAVAAAFFTMHALKDPALARKLTDAVHAGLEVLVTDGLKRALNGVVQLNSPNVHVLPLEHSKPVRDLLDNPPQGIGKLRKTMLAALGWGLELAEDHPDTALDWIGFYPFKDGSWVVENFANATKDLLLTVPSVEGNRTSVVPLKLQARSWKHHWTRDSKLLTGSQATDDVALRYRAVDEFERSCGAVSAVSCAPNCGSAIVTALETCSASGGGTVTLSAGIYVVNDTIPAAGPSLPLRNLANVQLVGAAGSGDYYTAGPDPAATTLMIYGLRGAFALSNCSNVRVRNIQIDMNRLPYTYGQCTAATETSFTLKFDPTVYPFDAPVPAYLLKVQSVMGFDPDNWRMAHDPVDIYTTASPYSAHLVALNLLEVKGGGSANNIKVGDWYVLRHMVYGPGGFSTSGSSQLDIENVQLYTIPGMGFVNSQTKDIHLKNCGVRWRPGRPMSITADASHFNECSGVVHLDGVHFEGQGDDGLNVHGMFHDVRQLDAGGTTFELGSRPAGGTSAMNVGGRYEFRNRNNWTIEGVGTCTATSIDKITGKQHATFDWEPGSGSISKFALLTDISLQPSVLIENSYFGNNRARGTLIKSSNVMVRNNVYNFTSMMCLLAFPDGCYWFESNGFHNWTIDNNTFIGCGAGGPSPDIFVAACAPTYDTHGLPTQNGNPITVGQPFADGKITHNHFVQHNEPHHAVELYGFDGLAVQDNTIDLVTSGGTLQPPKSTRVGHQPMFGLCGDLCGSLDGFEVTIENGARVHGWAVDVKLAKPNVSSFVTIEVDGHPVLTLLANGLRPDLVGPVSKEPQHGFDTALPHDVATQLLIGNHTLSVSARRQDGSIVPLTKQADCVNPGRRSCSFPIDCNCGAALPSRMLISNSIGCRADSNMCDGEPCAASEPAGGCVQ